MGLMDKLTEGAERAAREAEKAFDKGKTKVGELQTEMQMDGLARKLGYLVFDFYRGRQVDQAYRQKILDDMSRLEDQLLRARAQSAAKGDAAPGGGTASEGAASASGGAWAASESGGYGDAFSTQDASDAPRPQAETPTESGSGAASTDEASAADDEAGGGGDSPT
jgi:hypothetical protein